MYNNIQSYGHNIAIYNSQHNYIYDNDAYKSIIFVAENAPNNIFCVNGVGNRYYEGATGPVCLCNDFDGDGFLNASCGGNDCDDTNSNVHPGAQDVCNNIDDNCDGNVDEGYVPLPTTCGIGECASSGYMICESGALRDTCISGTPAAEICDGKDNDCDGSITDDGNDEVWHMQPTSCGMGVCASNGLYLCQEGIQTDTCQPQISMGPDNDCNGIDEDCDGVSDEHYIPTTTVCGTGACASGGQLICINGQTQDTCTPRQPTAELCDGLDNNCDGIIDNDEDQDGVCDGVDKCPTNVPGGNIWYATKELKNNHYDSTNWNIGDAYGCSCAQVLYCMPGKNEGEFKFGCSEGTKKIWEKQSPDSWAPDCQINGIVAKEGVSKHLFEDTDGDWFPDIIDSDEDNDGYKNVDDDMEDDRDPIGDPDHGIPDWHPKSRHINFSIK